MGYYCSEHGELISEWCEDCEKIVSCNCSYKTYTRFKDLIYDCEDGEKTITIRVHHCETCGEVSHVE